MIRAVAVIAFVQLAILINGCSDSPPKPVMPDGSYRVPVNRVAPVSPSDGGGHEQ